METKKTQTNQGSWGYRLSGKMHPASLGYLTMQIMLRKTPTGLHFDPEEIQLHLRESEDATVWHKYHLVERQIAPVEIGYTHIQLRDRKNKIASFLAFGGRLEHTAGTLQNVYTIHSEAPILDLNSKESNWTLELAAEIDILLARIHAHYHGNAEIFEKKLAGLDTLSRYAGTIHSICRRIEREKEPRLESVELLQRLQHERRFMERACGAATLEERLGW